MCSYTSTDHNKQASVLTTTMIGKWVFWTITIMGNMLGSSYFITWAANQLSQSSLLVGSPAVPVWTNPIVYRHLRRLWWRPSVLSPCPPALTAQAGHSQARLSFHSQETRDMCVILSVVCYISCSWTPLTVLKWPSRILLQGLTLRTCHLRLNFRPYIRSI